MTVNEYLHLVCEILHETPPAPIEDCVDLIYRAYRTGRTVFLIGNGGSASAASHFAQDLAKGAIADQEAHPRIRALSLTDNVSCLTAVANDDGFEYVYSAQLRTLASHGDVLIAISTSGRSPNVLEAIEEARTQRMTIVGVTGGAPSPLRDASDILVEVPAADAGLIEGVHSVLFHYIAAALRARISGVAVDLAAFGVRPVLQQATHAIRAATLT